MPSCSSCSAKNLVLLADAAERIAVRRAQVRERKGFLRSSCSARCRAGVLKETPDAAGALVLGHEGMSLPASEMLPSVDIKAARDGVEEGRLARTVRADDGDEIALVQMRDREESAFFSFTVPGLKVLRDFECPASYTPSPVLAAICALLERRPLANAGEAMASATMTVRSGSLRHLDGHLSLKRWRR